MSLVDSERDLEDYKTLLERYVELNKTNAIALTNAGKHIGDFYRLCHILRLPNAALGMFHSQVVDPWQGFLFLKHTISCHSILLIYNKMFQRPSGARPGYVNSTRLNCLRSLWGYEQLATCGQSMLRGPLGPPSTQ